MTLLTVGGARVRFATRSLLIGCALTAALLGISVVTMTTGDFHLSLTAVVRTILGRGTPSQDFIINTLRLPRLLTAILVGAALGVGGALFQGVARNPLASPDIIGFDSGAATGALLVILSLHGSSGQIVLGSLAGGLVTAIAVYLLVMRRGAQGYRLILIGIGIAAMLTSVNDYLLTRANLREAQSAALWLTGSLNGRGWEHVRPVALALLVLLPAAIWIGRELRMLELGEDSARALGVNPERTNLFGLVIGVALAAVATSCTGPIGFVALAAPQVARRLTTVAGPNVVASALTGAVVLTASDLAAQRMFGGTQLPVGVLTGAVGGAYLAWLLTREWRTRR